MNATASWLPWALGSAAAAALTAIFAKVALRGVDPDLATLWRTAVILLVLAGFVTATGKWTSPAAWSATTWVFLVLSALATGASWICYFRALQLGDASVVAPVDKLSVVLVALFAVAFLEERPSLRDWLALGLIAGGVVLLALRPR